MTTETADIDRLRSTVEAFCEYLSRLPAKAMLEQAWGPREVLSHLVFWHEGYVRQLEASRAGQPTLLPSGRFRDLNAQAVASLRGVGVPTLLARFRSANARLCRLAADPAFAHATVQIKDDSKVWPLGELIPRVEAHIRAHHRELRRAWPEPKRASGG